MVTIYTVFEAGYFISKYPYKMCRNVNIFYIYFNLIFNVNICCKIKN